MNFAITGEYLEESKRNLNDLGIKKMKKLIMRTRTWMMKLIMRTRTWMKKLY